MSGTLTNEETLQAFVLITGIEMRTLEDHDWLQVRIDVFGAIEDVGAFVVLNTQLEHVQNVTIVNAPKH